MVVSRSVRFARLALMLLAVLAAGLCAGLGGCKMRGVPGVATPDFALSTPAPLPPPGQALPAGAGSAPPGVPVVPNETYTLDSGCLLYTSDAADDSLRVDLGGRRIIKKIFF